MSSKNIVTYSVWTLHGKLHASLAVRIDTIREGKMEDTVEKYKELKYCIAAEVRSRSASCPKTFERSIKI